MESTVPVHVMKLKTAMVRIVVREVIIKFNGNLVTTSLTVLLNDELKTMLFNIKNRKNIVFWVMQCMEIILLKELALIGRKI